MTLISTACSWVNMFGGHKAAIFTQVGQFYFGRWVSFSSAVTARPDQQAGHQRQDTERPDLRALLNLQTHQVRRDHRHDPIEDPRELRKGRLGIPMIVTADSGDRDRAVPGPWI